MNEIFSQLAVPAITGIFCGGFVLATLKTDISWIKRGMSNHEKRIERLENDCNY